MWQIELGGWVIIWRGKEKIHISGGGSYLFLCAKQAKCLPNSQGMHTPKRNVVKGDEKKRSTIKEFKYIGFGYRFLN